MLSAASAVEDVDVGRPLIRVRFARLDLVVLRVAAARGKKLVLLQIALVILGRNKPVREIRHLHTRAGNNLRLGQNGAFRKAAMPRRDRPERLEFLAR